MPQGASSLIVRAGGWKGRRESAPKHERATVAQMLCEAAGRGASLTAGSCFKDQDSQRACSRTLYPHRTTTPAELTRPHARGPRPSPSAPAPTCSAAPGRQRAASVPARSISIRATGSTAPAPRAAVPPRRMAKSCWEAGAAQQLPGASQGVGPLPPRAVISAAAARRAGAARTCPAPLRAQSHPRPPRRWHSQLRWSGSSARPRRRPAREGGCGGTSSVGRLIPGASWAGWW